MQGMESPTPLDTMALLAITLREQGELGQARMIEEEILSARIKMLGEDNLPVLAAKANLTVTLLAQGHRKEAMSLATESLNVAIRVFGIKHTAATEAAWSLVQNCEPHEAARRRC